MQVTKQKSTYGDDGEVMARVKRAAEGTCVKVLSCKLCLSRDKPLVEPDLGMLLVGMACEATVAKADKFSDNPAYIGQDG